MTEKDVARIMERLYSNNEIASFIRAALSYKFGFADIECKVSETEENGWWTYSIDIQIHPSYFQYAKPIADFLFEVNSRFELGTRTKIRSVWVSHWVVGWFDNGQEAESMELECRKKVWEIDSRIKPFPPSID